MPTLGPTTPQDLRTVARPTFAGIDVNATVSSGNAVHIIANSITTGNGVYIEVDSLTTGIGMKIQCLSSGGGDLMVLEVGDDIAFLGDLMNFSGGGMQGRAIYVNGGSGSNEAVRLEGGMRSGATLQILKGSYGTVGLDVETGYSLLRGGVCIGGSGYPSWTPTKLVSFYSEVDATIGVERRTSSSAPGKALTISSGGAKSGSTNRSAGDLVLSTGVATGTGYGRVIINTAPAGASGTTDNNAATMIEIAGDTIGFYGHAPTVQPAAVADATGAGDVVGQLNALLARVRSLGIIAT